MNNRILFLLAVTVIASCTSGKQNVRDSASSDIQEWSLMDEFHMVIAESFHPYMDSGNLEPARKHAQEMQLLAEKWSKASLPERVNNNDVRNKLNELAAEAKVFNRLIQSGNETEMGEKLDHLHHIFHELQDAWYRSRE